MAENKILNWLDEVKADAERITLRRLQDDGFEAVTEVVTPIDAQPSRADVTPEAEVVAPVAPIDVAPVAPVA
jgi:hypothetical protein